MTFRLAALTSHPIQYQAPLFRELASRTTVDLTVYFCSRQGYEESYDPGFGQDIEWDVPLVEGYNYSFLRRLNILDTDNDFLALNPGVAHTLAAGDYDAVWVHGYGALTNWVAFAAARAVDVPIVLRGEGTWPDSPSVGERAKQRLLGALFEQITAFACIGTRNRRFYKRHGITDERLFHSPYTVDNEFFQHHAEQLPSTADLRAELGLPADRPVVLFVGKLLERKRPRMLLEAFTEATDPGDATLIFVGDGELSDAVKRRARELGREDDIVLTGFVNQGDLPRYYDAADVFALPSAQENWGLVVNEAMNFALPIVATEAVGCVDDLVADNGRVVPADDVTGMSTALKRLITDETLRAEMGERSLDLIMDCGIPETADGIIAAAQFAATR